MAVQRQEVERKTIPTLVKDSALVEQQRQRIVDAAVGLFIRRGFHETTTREIAKSAGFSIGTLYEYVSSKEDVLYLVCDAIHSEMEERLAREIVEGRNVEETLRGAIETYVRVCDRMQDSILLIYRETAALATESRRYVLQNEQRIGEIFERILERGVSEGAFGLDGEKPMRLMAHNIVVLGHMWAFRRWFLRKTFSLTEYVGYQTSLIMGELKRKT